MKNKLAAIMKQKKTEFLSGKLTKYETRASFHENRGEKQVLPYPSIQRRMPKIMLGSRHEKLILRCFF